MGHIISEKGVTSDPKKVQAVQELPAPKNPKEMKMFQGLVGYYRKSIKDFAKIASTNYGFGNPNKRYLLTN